MVTIVHPNAGRNDLSTMSTLTQCFKTFSRMKTLEMDVSVAHTLCHEFDWNTISFPHLTYLQFSGDVLFLFYKIMTISPHLQELQIDSITLHNTFSQMNNFPTVLAHIRLLHLTLTIIPSTNNDHYLKDFEYIATFMLNLKHLIFTLHGVECQGHLDILLNALLNQKRFVQLSTVEFQSMPIFSSLEFRQNPLRWFEENGLKKDSFYFRYQNNIEVNNRSRNDNEFLGYQTPDDQEELQLWF